MQEKLVKIIYIASGKKFQGNFIDFDDWEADQNQNLPKISPKRKSISIVRYAAKINDLTGKDSLEQAQADAVVEIAMEIIYFYYCHIFNIEDDDEKVFNLIFN